MIAMTGEARRKFALASIAVQKSDGSRILYLSLDYVPFWNLAARRSYKAAISEHIQSAGPVNEVHVECPNHPNPRKRKRKRRA